jgi:hypothetical protein
VNPWPHGDPRDVIRHVLADPRFARAPKRAAEKTWFEMLTDALGDLWHRITEPLRHLTGNSALTTAIGIAVLVVVAAGLTVVIALFVTRIARRRARSAAVATATEFGAGARKLLGLALEAAAAGRYHEAAALLWASALRALDEGGRVHYDPSRTPGEWRRIVRDPSFDALARDAVVALFADRDADAALFARMRESYDRVVAPG